MSDELKNALWLRVGLVNEPSSEGIFITLDHALWDFSRWITVLLLFEMLHFGATP
jgi:hypothetical protein